MTPEERQQAHELAKSYAKPSLSHLSGARGVLARYTLELERERDHLYQQGKFCKVHADNTDSPGCVLCCAESAEAERDRLRQFLVALRDGYEDKTRRCLPVPITSDWRYFIDAALSKAALKGEGDGSVHAPR